MSETADHGFSLLKLAVMRAIWQNSPSSGVEFEHVISSAISGDVSSPGAMISIQADAVLEAISVPNEDMILGGCLEANPIGALVSYDKRECSTQEDVVAVYKAMIREGRLLENRTRQCRVIA